MKILVLTQYFHPEPGFKLLPLTKELKNRGHYVEVITAVPNYPDGRIYAGYKNRPFQKEYIEGVRVLRFPLYASHDNSKLRRIGSYSSFALSSALLGTILAQKADIAYVYHGPATIGLPATALRLLRRIPYVYDVQDLWPEALRSLGFIKNRHLIRLIDMWCNYIYRNSSHIVTESQGFKEALMKKGVLENKLEVISNWCDEEEIRAAEKDDSFVNKYNLNGKFLFVYSGNMGRVHALGTVLEAAKIIATRYPDIFFLFIGGGIEVPQLKDKTKSLNLKNVIFLPNRPFSDLAKILKSCHVGIVHIKDDPSLLSTMSSKTQAYLATGLPILMAAKGDAADLVRNARAGVICTPNDLGSIVQAVEYFYNLPMAAINELGTNGKSFYYKELSLKTGVDKLENIFASIVKCSRVLSHKA